MQCVNTVEFCLLLTQLERRCFGGKRMHAKSSKFTKYRSCPQASGSIATTRAPSISKPKGPSWHSLPERRC